MSLSAGSLNRSVTFQSPDPSQDAFGQPSSGWTPQFTCWASVKAATSKEVYAASGFTSEVSHIITIRYPETPVRSSMRVLYDGRTFQVQAVADPDEGRVQLNVFCLELNEGT